MPSITPLSLMVRTPPGSSKAFKRSSTEGLHSKECLCGYKVTWKLSTTKQFKKEDEDSSREWKLLLPCTAEMHVLLPCTWNARMFSCKHIHWDGEYIWNGKNVIYSRKHVLWNPLLAKVDVVHQQPVTTLQGLNQHPIHPLKSTKAVRVSSLELLQL